MEQSAVVTKKREGKRSKMWIVFVIGAVLSWGVYGPALHKGQTQLGNPLKALLCVGFAYFLIGVLVPVAGLSSQGGLQRLQCGRHGLGHHRRRAGRAGGGLHHLGVQVGRASEFRDAAGFRRSAAGECGGLDGHASAEKCAAPAALRGVPAGGAGRRNRAVLQAVVDRRPVERPWQVRSTCRSSTETWPCESGCGYPKLPAS